MAPEGGVPLPVAVKRFPNSSGEPLPSVVGMVVVVDQLENLVVELIVIIGVTAVRGEVSEVCCQYNSWVDPSLSGHRQNGILVVPGDSMVRPANNVQPLGGMDSLGVKVWSLRHSMMRWLCWLMMLRAMMSVVQVVHSGQIAPERGVPLPVAVKSFPNCSGEPLASVAGMVVVVDQL